MKKLLIFTAILFCILTAKSQDTTTVFMWEQQSNCIGAALNTALDTSLNHPIANCYFWNGSSFPQLTPANCQFPYLSGIASGAILETMKKYQESHGGNVYGIMYSIVGKQLADNGTIATFYPLRKGTYADLAISTFNAGLSYLWNTKGLRYYKFIYVLQGGESDASTTANSNAYKTNLTNLITANIKNLQCSAYAPFPRFVVIPKITLAQGLNVTNTGIIQRACDTVSMTTIAGVTKIYTFSLDSCQVGAAPHFSAVGYKKEGDIINTFSY